MRLRISTEEAEEYLGCRPLPSELRSLEVYRAYNELATKRGPVPLNKLVLPDALELLALTDTDLDELPALPASLRHLHCSGNCLVDLPQLPPSLLELDCSDNYLTGLPALPSTLTVLMCNRNDLTELPELPDSLVELHCSTNQQLRRLPSLPAGLNVLWASDCAVSELPPLPPNLHSLKCADCQLAALPDLPHALHHLDCSGNRIVELPKLPNLLRSLQASDNRQLDESLRDNPFRDEEHDASPPFMRSSMKEHIVRLLVPGLQDAAAEFLRAGWFDGETSVLVLRQLLGRDPRTAIIRWHWLSGMLHRLGKEDVCVETEKEHESLTAL